MINPNPIQFNSIPFNEMSSKQPLPLTPNPRGQIKLHDNHTLPLPDPDPWFTAPYVRNFTSHSSVSGRLHRKRMVRSRG